ncbi:MAG: hypothetical protein JETT_0564 [Candidatus Jettenia ecosi]|uniref:Uncharacterized protein n=1 Tax=Candidatus Jettenia ecosi TaxID=2494326 RepID=A0A533QEU9_9BACT|nr:MAG: hypothetical protein JETT_0564 [Candidatus Jettenia ecosi]
MWQKLIFSCMQVYGTYGILKHVIARSFSEAISSETCKGLLRTRPSQ